METIDVNEIFGPTFQGEGSASGRHCLFVRLAHCNLECTWCDTPYTWAFSPTKAAKTISGTIHSKEDNIHPMAINDIVTELENLWPISEKPTMIVISGGEPLMQAKRLEALVRILNNFGCDVHIETAGTLKPTDMLHRNVAQYNVSPKLTHSGNRTSKRFRPEILKWFGQWDCSWFKFVVGHANDFHEIDTIVKECDLDRNRIMVMPEGVTIGNNIDTARQIAQGALNRGFGLSFRTHILLWPEVDRGK